MPVVTPVAHAIVREMCKPLKDRRLHDPDNIGRLIADFHCFDLTAVKSMIDGLCGGPKTPADEAAKAFGTLLSLPNKFTPSPMTCIRTHGADEETGGEAEALIISHSDSWDIRIAVRLPDRLFIKPVSIRITRVEKGCLGPDSFVSFPGVRNDEDEANRIDCVAELMAALVIINSPRVIGRTTIAPHAGLQRKVAGSKGMPGKYPLHATTEVKLIVGAREAGATEETRLSGDRALHFVRQHMRVVGGVLVQVEGVPVRLGGDQTLVKAHWRGNPALGIKRSRYRVEPAT